MLGSNLHLTGAALTAFVATAAIYLSNHKILAMALYSQGTTASVEEASRLDPGSYRIQMKAADNFMFGGNCDKARPHTLAANALAEVEVIMPISARLVVNKAALKLKRAPMRGVIDALAAAVAAAAGRVANPSGSA